MNVLKRLFGRRDAPAETGPAPAEPLLINAYATLRVVPPLDFLHARGGDATSPTPNCPRISTASSATSWGAATAG